MAPTADLPGRRSGRRLQDVYYNHNRAQFTLDLRNIRKLLNFTTNSLDDTERQIKRFKKDQIKCISSLTIWDNRPGGKSIVTRSGTCSLSVRDNGVYGPYISISSEEPFVFEAHELKVRVHRDGEVRNEIIDNYFLEVKLIPTRPDVSWPPFPILGKSEADHYSGPQKLPPDALKGALVMKYGDLPKAPEPSTPLKVFFAHDGVTFKTKYGVEVAACWSRPGTIVDSLERAKSDTEGPLAFESIVGITSDGPKAKRTGVRVAPTQANDLLQTTSKPGRHKRFKIRYYFKPVNARSQETLREYRTAELSVLACPACPNFPAQGLEELRFHFLSFHHKHNFFLAEFEDSADVLEALFEVTPIPAPKPMARILQSETKFEWLRPASQFDLTAFLNGDTSWLGRPEETTRIAQPRPVAGSSNAANLAIDSATELRRENDGFLTAEKVKDFRRTRPKKHPVIKLVRAVDNRVTSYTSVSHRETSPSEDPLSDTDDEPEDTWFVQRHLENLAITAMKEAWAPMKQEFFRRWDKHRLEEKLEHTRYISDSLVRFVRKEKSWLATPDVELWSAFNQLLAELQSSRFISSRVSAEVRNMISNQKDATQPLSTDREQPNNDDSTPAQTAPEPIHESKIKLIHLTFQHFDDLGSLDASKGLTDDQFNTYLQPLNIPRPLLDIELRKWKLPPPQPEPATEGPPIASPQEQITAWRTRTLLTRKGHCGSCSQPIHNLALEGVHCTSPTCATPNTWFHMTCVKLKKLGSRPSWVCQGCRAEKKFQLGIENAKGKGTGKGKETDTPETPAKGKGRAEIPES